MDQFGFFGVGAGSNVPYFPKCDHFDLQRLNPLKKDSNVLSNVNIFVCNSADVNVNVEVNSSSISRSDIDYQLVKNGRSSRDKIKHVKLFVK